MVKQELNAGEYEREIFFGTSYKNLGKKEFQFWFQLYIFIVSALKPRYFECDIDEILFGLIIYSFVSTSNKKSWYEGKKKTRRKSKNIFCVVVY